jgi:hypothetical protein
MGQMPPKSKLLPSAYHTGETNAINAVNEILYLLPRIELLNANPTHMVLTRDICLFYAKLKSTSYLFAMGFESRTLVLILVYPDNDIDCIMQSAPRGYAAQRKVGIWLSSCLE